MAKLKVEMIPIGSVIMYAKNARTHSDEQIKLLAASLGEFGFVNPVLIDAGGTLIAGHGRTLAAQSIGLKTIPAIRLDHLSEAQTIALRIADNSVALAGAGWDAELLQAELGQLEEMNFDLAPLGLDNITLPDLDDAEPAPPRSTKTKTTLFISVKNADAAKAKSIISAALKKAKIEANI